MDGYTAPLKRALTEKLTWGGVPRNLFLLNVLVCVFAVVILKTWTILLLGFICHFFLKFFTQKDPEFFGIFIQYLRTKDYYRSE